MGDGDLEERFGAVEEQLRRLAREIPAVANLLSIPGIGLITATALVAFVGDIRRFPTGRHSPATSASRRGNTPAAPGDGSEGSPSVGIATCACS